MAVRIKRVYEPAQPGDGYRVLVDRLWPRGVAKGQLQVDAWLREVAPSHELRRWFGHDPARWEGFRQRYRQELAHSQAQALLDALARRAGQGTVTLVYSARDEQRNQAVVLKEILDSLASGHGAT